MARKIGLGLLLRTYDCRVSARQRSHNWKTTLKKQRSEQRMWKREKRNGNRSNGERRWFAACDERVGRLVETGQSSTRYVYIHTSKLDRSSTSRVRIPRTYLCMILQVLLYTHMEMYITNVRCHVLTTILVHQASQFPIVGPNHELNFSRRLSFAASSPLSMSDTSPRYMPCSSIFCLHTRTSTSRS